MNTKTQELKKIDINTVSVKRGVFESKKPVTPIADLSSKGVFDSVSSNRSKQNDQKS